MRGSYFYAYNPVSLLAFKSNVSSSIGGILKKQSFSEEYKYHTHLVASGFLCPSFLYLYLYILIYTYG
ncbi:hypothetical protein BDF14DRAFT_1813515 [Spinellus fusiger]|nr:hypothetical protein BDF14DRAFT_1813515 [Spinellus fusiger]